MAYRKLLLKGGCIAEYSDTRGTSQQTSESNTRLPEQASRNCDILPDLGPNAGEPCAIMFPLRLRVDQFVRRIVNELNELRDLNCSGIDPSELRTELPQEHPSVSACRGHGLEGAFRAAQIPILRASPSCNSSGSGQRSVCQQVSTLAVQLGRGISIFGRSKLE